MVAIDPVQHQVKSSNGEVVAYDRLLLTTGAEPVRLPIPGAGPSQVHILRSLDDCRALIKATDGAKRALVIGASFIGLEVAASLRARKIEVHVVALAEAAGLILDRGVEVNACLQTSAPNIYAAGDIARWPDPHSGAKICVEHWVVAERQGRLPRST